MKEVLTIRPDADVGRPRRARMASTPGRGNPARRRSRPTTRTASRIKPTSPPTIFTQNASGSTPARPAPIRRPWWVPIGGVYAISNVTPARDPRPSGGNGSPKRGIRGQRGIVQRLRKAKTQARGGAVTVASRWRRGDAAVACRRGPSAGADLDSRSVEIDHLGQGVASRLPHVLAPGWSSRCAAMCAFEHAAVFAGISLGCCASAARAKVGGRWQDRSRRRSSHGGREQVAAVVLWQ